MTTPAKSAAEGTDVLLFSVEQGRFGPPRLPEFLSLAALRVGALAPAHNLLSVSSHLSCHHVLPEARTFAELGGALCAAIESSRPRLIVPGDEQAVMIMQALLGPRGRRLVGKADTRVAATIAESLGDPAHYDASLLKTRTLAVARQIGVLAPESVTVASASAAAAAAGRMGYPVYLKESFSWAGRGVTRCDDAAGVRAAFAATRHQFGRLRHFMRWFADRDWYPVETETDLQCGIAGKSAMVCALAWRGVMVGAICGERLVVTKANGPSIAARISHDPVMVDSTARMIAALGLHGFAAFDFMVPDDGSAPLLLECNPRPVPILHLGVRVGVDFGQLLAALMRNEIKPDRPWLSQGSVDVLLFPHSLDPAWVREAEVRGWQLDVPAAEPGLLAAMQDRPAAERAAPPIALGVAAA